MDRVSKAWGRVTRVSTKYWLQIIFPFHTLGSRLLRHLLSAPRRVNFRVFDALGAAACVFLMQYLLSTPSWVYTNDAWIEPRPVSYTSGGESGRRCGRWMRRVWVDEERNKRDGQYLCVACVSFNCTLAFLLLVDFSPIKSLRQRQASHENHGFRHHY